MITTTTTDMQIIEKHIHLSSHPHTHRMHLTDPLTQLQPVRTTTIQHIQVLQMIEREMTRECDESGEIGVGNREKKGVAAITAVVSTTITIITIGGDRYDIK